MKRLLPLLGLLLLTGQDGCSYQPYPGYCKGTEGVVASAGLNVEAAYAAIIGGTPSVERRSTMRAYMPGKGSCTAVVIGPRTAITAAHCRNAPPFRHLLQVKVGARYYEATGWLEHPDYTKYRSDPSNLEARKADLMLWYFDEDLPQAPPENRVVGFYDIDSGIGGADPAKCTDIIAQGFGQTEQSPEPCPDGASTCLREGPYTVTQAKPKQLYTKHAVLGPVAICFGDSGGPLYIKVDGVTGLHLAGVTSTTFSEDCLVASHHTRVSAFQEWVFNNWQAIGVAGQFAHGGA